MMMIIDHMDCLHNRDYLKHHIYFDILLPKYFGIIPHRVINCSDPMIVKLSPSKNTFHLIETLIQ